MSPQDTEDVVPLSVVANLEVWSSDGTSIRDDDPNVRIDGTTRNFAFFHSSENHENTPQPGSDAMNWVAATIRNAYAF